MSDTTRISFAELADRLGVVPSGAAAGRHRAPRASSNMGRLVAGAVAGAAFTGGVAVAAAPAAAAQSAELDVDHLTEMAHEVAQGIGLNEDQLRQYAVDFNLDPAVFGSLGVPSVGGAHAPTHGPITSGFGPRWGTFHNGTDFGAPIGTPLYAAKSGTVVARS